MSDSGPTSAAAAPALNGGTASRAAAAPASNWLHRVLRGEWPMCLLTFVIYLRLPDVFYDNWRMPWLMEMLTLLLAGVIVGRCLLLKEWPHGWLLPGVLLAAYAGAMALSVRFAPEGHVGYEAIIPFGKYVVLAMLTLLLAQRPASLRYAVWGLLAAGLVMAGISTYQGLSGSFDPEFTFWRLGMFEIKHIHDRVDAPSVGGPVGDPNFYAEFLIVLIPLALDRLWAKRKLPMLLIAAAALWVLLMAMVFTYSRGGFLALIAVGLGMAVVAVVRRPGWMNLALTAAVLIGCFLLTPDAYMQRMGTFRLFSPWHKSSDKFGASVEPQHAGYSYGFAKPQAAVLLTAATAPGSEASEPRPSRKGDAALPGVPADDEDLSAITDQLRTDYGMRGRLSEMIVGWEMFKSRPIFGMGQGSYRLRYLEYSRPLGIDPRDQPREAHCLYLEIAAETGAVGLAAFGAIMLLMAVRLWRGFCGFMKAGMNEDAHTVVALGVGLLGFFVAAVFLHAAFMHGFWVVAALALASGAIARRVQVDAALHVASSGRPGPATPPAPATSTGPRP